MSPKNNVFQVLINIEKTCLGVLEAIAKLAICSFANHFLAYYAKLYNRAERFESKKVEVKMKFGTYMFEAKKVPGFDFDLFRSKTRSRQTNATKS